MSVKFKAFSGWPDEIPIDPIYEITSIVMNAEQKTLIENATFRTSMSSFIAARAKERNSRVYILCHVYENSQGKIPRMQISMNNHLVFDDYMQYKERFCVPTDVTEDFRDDQNIIAVKLHHAREAKFLLAVATGRKLTFQHIYANIKTLDSEISQRKVMNSFKNNNGEMQESLVKVSFKCPILGRIKRPVRGKDCNHFQCFELENYVVQNEKSHIWVCPVCKSTVIPQNLLEDMYFKRLLDNEKDFKKIDVKITPNGRVETSDPDARIISSEVISIDSDDDDLPPQQQIQQQMMPRTKEFQSKVEDRRIEFPPEMVDSFENPLGILDSDVIAWVNLFKKNGYEPNQTQREMFCDELKYPMHKLVDIVKVTMRQ